MIETGTITTLSKVNDIIEKFDLEKKKVKTPTVYVEIDSKYFDYPSKYFNRDIACKEIGGANVTPNIRWSAVPDAQSYSLLCFDVSAKSRCFVLWFIPYIEPINDRSGIEEIPSGIFEDEDRAQRLYIDNREHIQNLNSYGKFGWDGPCQINRENSSPHYFFFDIYATKTSMKTWAENKLNGNLKEKNNPSASIDTKLIKADKIIIPLHKKKKDIDLISNISKETKRDFSKCANIYQDFIDTISKMDYEWGTFLGRFPSP